MAIDNISNSAAALDSALMKNHHDTDAARSAQRNRSTATPPVPAVLRGLVAGPTANKAVIGRRQLFVKAGQMVFFGGAGASLLAGCGEGQPSSGMPAAAAAATATTAAYTNELQAGFELDKACAIEEHLILEFEKPGESANPKVKRAYQLLYKAGQTVVSMGDTALLLDNYRNAVRDAKVPETQAVHDARVARAIAQIAYLKAKSAPADLIQAAEDERAIDEAMLTQT